MHHLNLHEMEKAQHFAEEGVRVAERLGDAARLVGAHVSLGGVLFFQGKLETALVQFRRGFETFDPNMQFPDWPGPHPAVACQFFPMLIVNSPGCRYDRLSDGIWPRGGRVLAGRLENGNAWRASVAFRPSLGNGCRLGMGERTAIHS